MTVSPFDGKLRRFITGFLPVDRSRTGECLRCGACCRFLFECPFLKPSKEDPLKFVCTIYSFRPPQCRKYPRTKSEQTHHPCGYVFEGPSE